MNDRNEKTFEKIGLMLDCSRNGVPNIESLKLLIDLLSKMGYNRLELYTEDVYELQDRPYFGYLRGRYSGAELKEIDAYALDKGIELTPCIQVLAHLNSIFRYGQFDEVRDINDILLVDEPKTYELIEDMFRFIAENFTSREVNIGCDEAHMLGLGKFLSRFGYENRLEIFRRHLEKVLNIAKKYGFTCSIWNDMYFRLATGGYDPSNPIPPDVLNSMPENLSLIYYNYTAVMGGMFEAHKQFKNEIEFAGPAYKWLGFAPDNTYSIKCADVSVAEARKFGIKKIMLTAWGDDGCEASIFSILPTLYYFGALANGRSVDEETMNREFQALTGLTFREFMSIDISRFEWLDKKEGFHGKASNAEKVFLYNDCFCGIFDVALMGDEANHYAGAAKKLKRLEKGKFAYLIKTLRALCEVLSLKADIGVRTRQAYQNNNRTALYALAEEYGVVAKRLETFYKYLRKQWMIENKPFGFEIQDIRLGGLIQRMKSCRQTLVDYCAKRIEYIPELKEELLPLSNNIVDSFGAFLYGGYSLITSVNNL